MKTTGYLIALFWFGIFVVGCKQPAETKSNTPSSDSLSIPNVSLRNPMNDTAQRLINEMIHWYNDTTKIPLLKDSGKARPIRIGNLDVWEKALRESLYFHPFFCDSIIPTIQPDYYAYVMDYSYPISQAKWMMQSKYTDGDYTEPFYGYKGISKIQCNTPNEKGEVRCDLVMDSPSFDSHYVAWLKKENGKWWIYQFMPENSILR